MIRGNGRDFQERAHGVNGARSATPPKRTKTTGLPARAALRRPAPPSEVGRVRFGRVLALGHM
ncbi:hypothetical protein GCM10027440_24660 [Nocardiopsis coralliicola]